MKLNLIEHTVTIAPDTVLNCATRYPANRTDGLVYVGGQTGNTSGDRKAWVNDRLDYHAGKRYEGWWGMGEIPLRTTAADLSIKNATYSRPLNASQEVAYVASGTTLEAFWGVKFGEISQGSREWEYKLFDAFTGEVVVEGTSNFFTNENGIVHKGLGVVPDCCYLLFVRIKAGIRKYVWIGDAFTEQYAILNQYHVTYPAQYQWTHEDGTVYYYDPVFNVGALPYDPTKTDQKKLLDELAANLAEGKVVKVPEWTSYLFTFNEDGTFTEDSGEWAALRIAVNASWIGDANCSPDASVGESLWVVDAETNQLVPVVIDPTTRAVGAFYIEPETNGGLWVGAMTAGRSGRSVSLYKLEYDADDFEAKSLTITDTARLYCECALSDESLNSIVRYPDKPLDDGGKLHALSYCEHFTYDPSKPYSQRLIAEHPGGRSLTVVKKPTGIEGLVFATENDFARNERFNESFNYILYRENNVLKVGPGTAHHYDSILANYGGYCYGIEEDTISGLNPYNDYDLEDNKQYLSFFNGSNWNRVAGWYRKKRDMKRVARCGGHLLSFGTNEAGNPIVFRLSGNSLAFDLECDYHVERADTWRGNNEETVFIIGRKVDSEGTLLDGWYVAETTSHGGTGNDDNPTGGGGNPNNPGNEPEICFLWNDEEQSFCASNDDINSVGFHLENFAQYLTWDEEEFMWRVTNTLPDDEPYLSFDTSDPAVSCYVLHGTIPYDVAVWDSICFIGDETGGGGCFAECCSGGVGCGGFCLLNSTLQNKGINPASLPAFLVFNGTTYIASSSRPQDDSSYYEKVSGTNQTCYKWHPGDNGGGGCDGGVCDSFCVLNAVLTLLGLNPADLPPYLVWNGVTYAPSNSIPSSGVAYMELVIGSTMTCYKPHNFPGGKLCHLNSELTTLGTPPESLPAYYVWDADNDEWDADDEKPADGVAYFKKVIGSTQTCYVWHPKEGGKGGGTPNTSCDTADCVVDRNPGSKVHIIKYPAQGQTAGTVSAVMFVDVSPNEDGKTLGRVFPSYWIRIDGDSAIEAVEGEELTTNDHDTLKEFNQRILYGRDAWLNLPASSNVELVIIVPAGSNYELAPALTPRF